jgi:hypothetical protein
MAVAAILNFEELIQFLNFSTNLQKMWLECYDTDKEQLPYIEKYVAMKTKLAAAAILDFEDLMPFRYYLTNPHPIWWKTGNVF